MLVGTLTNILVKKFLGRKFIPRFAKYLIKFPDYEISSNNWSFEKPTISGNLWFVYVIYTHLCIETYSSFRVHIGKQTPKLWFLNSVKQANGGSNRKSTL